jgi:predicted  nucleic acid-binding Zn-ribbon protein
VEEIMIKDLENLIALQEIDSKIFQQNVASHDFPESVAQLTGLIEAATKAVASASEKMDAVAADIRAQEGIVVKSKAALEKSSERLNAISTNREYDAVHTEIENFKNAGTQAEGRLKSLAQQKEQLAEALVAAQQELEKVKAENEPKIAELKAKIDSIQTIIDEITVERNKIVPLIGSHILRTYDFIRKRKKNGQAVGLIKGNSRNCAQCFKILEIQILNEVKKNSRPVQCQNCGAILIWDEQTQAPQE